MSYGDAATLVTDPAPQDENTDYLDQQFGDYKAAVAKSETATQASQQAAANNDSYLVTTILLAVALFFADDPTFDAGVNFVRARRHRAIVGAVAALLGWVLLLAGVVGTQSLLGLGVPFSFTGFVIGSVGMLAVAGWLFGRRRKPVPTDPDRLPDWSER